MDRFLPQAEWATALKQSGTEVLDAEFQAERASALGSGARRLEAALATADQADHPTRLATARQRCWEFMVQRETLGLRDWPTVVRLYNIPHEVLQNMGAVPVKGHEDTTSLSGCPAAP